MSIFTTVCLKTAPVVHQVVQSIAVAAVLQNYLFHNHHSHHARHQAQKQEQFTIITQAVVNAFFVKYVVSNVHQHIQAVFHTASLPSYG